MPNSIPPERTANIVSVSGGKDSTATALLAVEQGIQNLSFVFADTGNEHQVTYDYIDYLSTVLPNPIRRVRGNFDAKIAHRRNYIRANWGSALYEIFTGQGDSHQQASDKTYAAIVRASKALKPTGNPFLDLCLWKGRFPSRMAQFCTQELKSRVLDDQVVFPAAKQFDRVVSWQGIRRDESTRRRAALKDEMIFGNADTGAGLWVHRPIVDWTAADVFDYHRANGVKWNPLYEQGMGRVGCMPCINSTKNELREIAQRFPEEIERLADWEDIVSQASKRGASTFFVAKIVSDARGEDYSLDDFSITHKTHGIHAAVEWANTPKGGRLGGNQIPLFEVDAVQDVPVCSSIYGLCE